MIAVTPQYENSDYVQEVLVNIQANTVPSESPTVEPGSYDHALALAECVKELLPHLGVQQEAEKLYSLVLQEAEYNNISKTMRMLLFFGLDDQSIYEGLKL